MSTGAAAPPAVAVRLPALAAQARWTVALRLVLALPQLVVVSALSVAALVLVVVGWLAALVTGRLPAAAATFLGRFVAYRLRVTSYLYLLTDRYPPFAWGDTDHPAQVRFDPGPLNRFAVLVRIVLALPALVLAGLLAMGWGCCAFVVWVVTLVKGTMPLPAHSAASAVARFDVRTDGYLLLLTATYPGGAFGDPPEAPRASVVALRTTGEDETPADTTEPAIADPARWCLPLSGGARVLMVLFVVLGLAASAAYAVAATRTGARSDTTASALAALNVGYASATQTVAEEDTALSQCSAPSDADPLACVQGVDHRLALAMASLSSALTAIDFPAYTQPSAGALVQVTQSLRQSLIAADGATSVQQYEAQAQGLGPLFSDVNAAYRSLEARLTAGR